MRNASKKWMRLCGESTCLPQEDIFNAHANSDPTPRAFNTNLTGVETSDMKNILPAETLFQKGRLLLVQERFLNTSAEFRKNSLNHPQRFYGATSRPFEQLDLLVEGNDFYIPTGGVSSSNAQCEYDWDIFINNQYYKTFRGYSGAKSTGLRIVKKNNTKIKDDVFLYRQSDTADIRHNYSTTVPIKADYGYRILPFYVQQTSNGQLNKCTLGTAPSISITSEQSKFNIRYQLPTNISTTKANTLRIWQYVAICPHGKEINRNDIKTYLLYLSVPDLWDRVVDICELEQGHSCTTDFAAKILKEQDIKPCRDIKWIMPVAHSVKYYPEHTSPKHIQRNQMLITIRPNAKYPPQQAWLRAFGFNPNLESFEIWNSQNNKDLLLEVAGIITPEMVCDQNCTSAGNNTFRSWFDGCSNLKKVDLIFHHTWNNVKTCGDFFSYRMFANCHNLTDFNPNWSEPQGFTAVGDYHNMSKYMNCTNLVCVSKNYNESYNIRQAGIGFGSYEFSGCTNLITPSIFYTEPRQFDNTPPAINSYKFENCTNLNNFHQYNETKIQGNSPQAYLAGKFDGTPL